MRVSSQWSKLLVVCENNHGICEFMLPTDSLPVSRMNQNHDWLVHVYSPCIIRSMDLLHNGCTLFYATISFPLVCVWGFSTRKLFSVSLLLCDWNQMIQSSTHHSTEYSAHYKKYHAWIIWICSDFYFWVILVTACVPQSIFNHFSASCMDTGIYQCISVTSTETLMHSCYGSYPECSACATLVELVYSWKFYCFNYFSR